MPELPEVETIKRSLEPLVKNRTITGVDVYYGGIIKYPGPADFCGQLKGKIIREVGRRGKYLLFELSDDYTLVIHLRMTGQLIASKPGVSLAKHTHLVFRLSGGQELRFVDIRKFGLIYLIKKEERARIKGLYTLGPEPLDEGFTLALFEETVGKAKGGLKAFLLNQTRVAGIGNIYADEILFESGLHPVRKVESLKKEEIKRLYEAIRKKLGEGVEFRGTSFRDYVDGKGEKGGFQERLKVYDRGNQPCARCGQPLVKTAAASRGTVFCPRCQG